MDNVSQTWDEADGSQDSKYAEFGGCASVFSPQSSGKEPREETRFLSSVEMEPLQRKEMFIDL